MNKVDKIIVGLMFLSQVLLWARVEIFIDNVSEMRTYTQYSVKALSKATLANREEALRAIDHCDVAGERTDDLWDEVFGARE